MAGPPLTKEVSAPRGDCPMDVSSLDPASAAAASAAAASVAASAAVVGVVAASAAAVSPPQVGTEEGEVPKEALAPMAPAWDAHLDNPPDADPATSRIMQETRRASLCIGTDACSRFIDSCEFIGLGCFCAISNAMNLLGVKRNSYPFDWVRSSLDSVIHCLDMQFEDFLTYSTYTVSGHYVVFGGTRWGGSFWHHNVEAPLTRLDMSRRIDRFYGRGNVQAKTPRVFARVVNSSREVLAAARLRDSLREALPDASEVYLLLVVDQQEASGLMAVTGEQGRGILFYALTEAETQASLQAGADESFRLTSENYARALAAAVRCWAGETPASEVRVFSSLRDLSSCCVQYDGGDPGRELFTPKKFYGQVLTTPSLAPATQHLLARVRVQMFVLPPNTDIATPLQVECFGMRIRVFLPPGTQSGHTLQLLNSDGVLSGTVSTAFNNQVVTIGQAVAEEMC